MNRKEPIDVLVGGICERLRRAVGAREALVALGDPVHGTVRYRHTHDGLVENNDGIDDPAIIAIMGGGNPRCLSTPRGPAMYTPLRDDARTIGALAILADSAVPAYDDSDLVLAEAFGAYLSLAVQRASLRERTRHLEELIAIDSLTGVANRRALDRMLEREWNRSVRSRRPVAFALLDIDHFKLYNDTYGHVAGDVCLQKIAHSCNASIVRATDLFARYGGEEFGIVLGDADLAAGAIVAERIRATVERLAIPHEKNEAGVVTVSVGVASMRPERGQESVELVERADRALYRAKDTGRNMVVLLEEQAEQPEPEPEAV